MSSTWCPQEIFEGEIENFVLVILNTKILSENKVIDLWNKAKFKVTVDGGTNRWYKIASENSEKIRNPNPDLITGDLDSIDCKILEYYVKESVGVIRTPDQNYTDFTKALFEIFKLFPESTKILAFAEHSGRLDQIFGIFETLFHVQGKNIFVVSSTSIEWLLGSGLHNIVLPKHLDFDKLHCGLIPLGLPCPGVKTSGFKWNLDGDTLLAFGQLVSTSNKFDKNSEKATVETKQPLLLTIELIAESDL